MQAAIPSTKIVTKIEANPLLVSRENEYRQLKKLKKNYYR